MAETPVRRQDQFLVRLPDGMRERIKAKAERAGMSMNEAIVFCLEAWFPAPKTLEQKIDELASRVAALKQGSGVEEKVDGLINEIEDALREVDAGRIDVPPAFREQVERHIEHWDEAEAERLQDLAHNPFDEANYPEIGGVPFEEIDWEAPIDPDEPLAPRPRKQKP